MKTIHSIIIMTALIILALCGCATLEDKAKELAGDALQEFIDKALAIKKGEKRPEFQDDTDLSDAHWGRAEASTWPITHDCTARFTRGSSRVHIEQTGSSEWPPIQNVSASVWFARVRPGTKTICRQWDYFRPGQKEKEFPWDDFDLKTSDDLYVFVTGLVRDARRNVYVRSKAAKIQR
jgi:hypothetical protein